MDVRSPTGCNLGIDFGSRLIKAARWDSPRPKTIRLAPDRPFVLNRTPIADDGQVIRRGVDHLSAHRHGRVSCVGEGLNQAGDKIAVGRTSYDAVEMQRAVAACLNRSLRRCGHAIDGLAVSVPSHWPVETSSLLTAMAAEGWRPTAFVPEALAALAAAAVAVQDELILVSWGESGIKYAHCQNYDGRVRVTRSGLAGSSSFRVFRRRMLSLMAGQVVSQSRIDPREQADSYHRLEDELESALPSLCRGRRREIVIPTGQERVKLELERSMVDERGTEAVDEFHDLVASLRTQALSAGVPVLCWGAMAELFPAALSAVDVQKLPIDIVALGGAKLCQSLRDGRLPRDHSTGIEVATPDGKMSQWVLCGVPSAVLVRREAGHSDFARLIGLEKAVPTIDVNRPRLLIGRLSTCHCALRAKAFPTVSGRHLALSTRSCGSVMAEDLQSTNGTFLNKKRLESRSQLEDGDIIQLGESGPSWRFSSPPHRAT